MNEKGEVIKAEKVWNIGTEVKEFLSNLDDEISGVVEAGYSHYTMMVTCPPLRTSIVIYWSKGN